MIINYFAIVVAALAAMIVGTVWYSQYAFGAKWFGYLGRNPKELQNMKMPAQSIIIEFVFSLITAYVLAIFTVVFGAHTLYSTILLALIVWVGFYVTHLLGQVVWERQPFGLFLINAGLRLVNLVIMTVIIGLWQ